MNEKYKIAELLYELEAFTNLEYEGFILTKEQSTRYLEIYEYLIENKIEIPFGIEI